MKRANRVLVLVFVVASVLAPVPAGGALVDDFAQTQMLVDNDGEQQYTVNTFPNFGWDTAVSGDTIAVSGAGDVVFGTFAGSVEVFVPDGDGWTRQATLEAPTPVAGARFGFEISLDGDLLAVIDDGNAGFIFERTGATWGAPQVVAGDFTDVATDGTRVVFGSPDSGDSGSVFVYTKPAATWALEDTLTGATAGDAFGRSVDVDGSNLIAGAPGNNGSVGVFSLDGTWALDETLMASDATGGDFGRDVALDGDVIAVDAPGRSDVYIFEHGAAGWTEEGMVDTNSIAFWGTALDIDAGVVVAGCVENNSAGTLAGRVRVFGDPGAGWQQIDSSLPAATGEYNHFGHGAAIDGMTVVVGAPQIWYSWSGGIENRIEGNGWALVYDWNGAALAIDGTLTPDIEVKTEFTVGSAAFGSALALDGTTLVVGGEQADDGTKTAWVFEAGSPFTKMAEIELGAGVDWTGSPIDVSGNRFVVGAPGDDTKASNAGAVHVYARGSEGWAFEQTLYADVPSEDAKFGSAVAIDGDLVGVGARGAGSIHTFDLSAPKQRVFGRDRAVDNLGSTLAMGGGTMIAGSGWFGDDPARVYVYEFDGSNWNEAGMLESSDLGFGLSGLAADGDTAMIGASHANQASVFRRGAGGWALEDTIPGDGSWFGWSVGLDGDVGVIGSNFGEYVYLVERTGSSWSSTLLQPEGLDGLGGDLFGSAVAIDGPVIVAGAPSQDDATGVTQYEDMGVVRVFGEVIARTCNGLAVTVAGATDGDDVLIGTSGDDVIAGGGGDDEIYGMGGDDLLCGDDGDDTIRGDAGVPSSRVASDSDTIYGGDGADVLYGDSGDDTIYGEAGADTIDGGSGDDTIDGGYHNDTLDGGEGADTIDGDVGVDVIFGGPGDDTIDGGPQQDRIRGGDGNDTIDGHRGADLIFGEAGDDRLYGNVGGDRIYGGDGNDKIFGQLGHDDLNGDAGNDRITGGNGNDLLVGGDGIDLLAGQVGADTLEGGDHRDRLNGGAGTDTADGGPEYDICVAETLLNCEGP